jgi:hypothetical protein
MSDVLDGLMRDLTRRRGELAGIAGEHQAVADAARAEQEQIDQVLNAIGDDGSAPRSPGRRKA